MLKTEKLCCVFALFGLSRMQLFHTRIRTLFKITSKTLYVDAKGLLVSHPSKYDHAIMLFIQRGAKVGAPGSVNMRRKIAFSCLLQAEERNFLPHIHGTQSADFSPPL